MKIRQTVIVILVICLLYLLGETANTLEVPGDTIVYVTDSGTKYHRDGCSYLESKYAITKSDAERKGYEPCSRCDPDVKTGTYTSDWDSEKSSKGTNVGKDKNARNSNVDPRKTDTDDIILCVLFLLPVSGFFFWEIGVILKCLIVEPIIEMIKKKILK